jgi:pimeloyl-ACP methyl ester carboxylesterase
LPEFGGAPSGVLRSPLPASTLALIRLAPNRYESPALEAQFKTLSTPALIVWGVEDKILHPAGAETLCALFPNSDVRLMAGIGHLPMMEAPAVTAKDYLEFRHSRGLA